MVVGLCRGNGKTLRHNVGEGRGTSQEAGRAKEFDREKLSNPYRFKRHEKVEKITRTSASRGFPLIFSLYRI